MLINLVPCLHNIEQEVLLSNLNMYPMCFCLAKLAWLFRLNFATLIAARVFL